MVAAPSRMRALLSELRRRNVGHVAAVYAIVGWLVIQVAATTFPMLHLPDWARTFVAVLVLLGFPIALVLAWAYELTPEGIRRAARQPPVAGALSAPRAAAVPSGRTASHGAGLRDPADTGEAESPPAAAPPGAGERRAAERTRLIVLPFRILRSDPETDFLAFSLPDAVTCSLSGLRSLVVRSNVAAFRFDEEAPDLAEIASAADVDVILTGTLLRVGAELRVRTQLAEAPSGTLLWSQTSQVSLGDLFQLQDELTHRIVDSLALPLTAREHRLLEHDVPASARAYEFYLRGNQVAEQVNQWTTARDLYLQAIEADPRYAPAWARLARCYRLLAKWATNAAEIPELQSRAEAAFRRALELNPEHPIAHNLYAQLKVDLGDAQAAMIGLLARADAMSADPEFFVGLVHACRYCGLLEASRAAHEQARRLDRSIRTSVAHTYFFMGEYERVLGEVAGDIGYIEPLTLGSLGRTDEAIRMLRQREQALGSSGAGVYLASLRALLEGQSAQSVAASERAAAHLHDGEGLFYLVRQLAYLGESERALDMLGRVVEMGYSCFPALERDPWLNSLRPAPRFRELLDRVEMQYRQAEAAFAAAGGEGVLSVGAPA